MRLVAVRSVILVEGESDRAALEALAGRRGRPLAAEDVAVVPMGGATNIDRFLDRFGPRGLDVRLAGLCDAGEEGHFRRALARAGLGPGLSRDGMEALGFYVCAADLEDELIRALGPAAVQRVIEAQGELRSLRILQRQPAQRERTLGEQLHRFIGTRSGRKSQYARLMVAALDLTRVPRPLDRVLAHVLACR
ncbi:MAG TPA: TOPRIM nucleotidyl transferase/hydrolase domain-containing protein [Streptosporangiaceae bacterium]|nr:TOPRIM nucleotidyl transferase/hydrolase domain-containing protein [Streptosporangiaceae bacterium]